MRKRIAVLEEQLTGATPHDLSRLLVTSAWQGMDETQRAADPDHGRTFILEARARGRSEPDVKL